MTNNNPFEYDVALSFANEDRDIAEAFASLLADRDIKVFQDEYTAGSTDLWRKDPVAHLVNLCARKARYCVMLLSKQYFLTKWTEAERTAVKERALRDADEYILPIRLDDNEVPGSSEVTGYHDLHRHSMESIVDFLEQRLTQAKRRSGPPTQSHDLRSGNVPAENDPPMT